MVPPVFTPIQYQYRCQHPLYRLPIPVAGWRRAKPSAEFRAPRRSGSRPDPRASRPSPVRFYLAAARRSARACGRPPPLPKPTVSNIPPGRSIPTPCRRRSHDRTIRGPEVGGSPRVSPSRSRATRPGSSGRLRWGTRSPRGRRKRRIQGAGTRSVSQQHHPTPTMARRSPRGSRSRPCLAHRKCSVSVG